MCRWIANSDKTAKEGLEYKLVDGITKCSEVYLDLAKLHCSESLLHHMFVLTKWWNNNSWALSCAMSTQLRKIKHKKRANVYIISPLFYFRNKKSMLLYYMVVLLRIFLLLWRGKYIERNIAMVRVGTKSCDMLLKKQKQSWLSLKTHCCDL